MLSVQHMKPMTFTRGFVALSTLIVASTAAAPDMSVFIVIIPSPDFSERPPESNMMPLPTSATEPGGVARRVGELDEAGRLVGAAVHAEQPAEAAPLHGVARPGSRR